MEKIINLSNRLVDEQILPEVVKRLMRKPHLMRWTMFVVRNVRPMALFRLEHSCHEEDVDLEASKQKALTAITEKQQVCFAIPVGFTGVDRDYAVNVVVFAQMANMTLAKAFNFQINGPLADRDKYFQVHEEAMRSIYREARKIGGA